jgi:ABC-2 type transport system permease protein
MSHAQTAAQAELLAAGPSVHAAPSGWRGAFDAGWTAMPDTLHAEWTKLRTVSGTAWLLIAVVTLTVAVSAAAVAATKCNPSLGCPADTTKLSLTGIYLGQAAVAVLAVLAVGNEYSTGMIRVTLAAMPRRLAVLAAKGAIVGALVLMAGAVAVAGSLLAGRLILPGNGFTVASGFPALSLAHGPTLRAACGSVLYLALIALFSLGIAAAVRDSAVSIGLSLGVLYAPILIATTVTNPVWLHRLERYTPMNAGLTIQATTGLRSLAITPWAGLGVLALWAAGALLAGGLLLRLRDA